MPLPESVNFLELLARCKCGPSIFVTAAGEQLVEDDFKFFQLELSMWAATKRG